MPNRNSPYLSPFRIITHYFDLDLLASTALFTFGDDEVVLMIIRVLRKMIDRKGPKILKKPEGASFRLPNRCYPFLLFGLFSAYWVSI
jgi:hypothetical protein